MTRKILYTFILLFLGITAFSQTAQTIYVQPDINGLKSYTGRANRVFVISKNQDYIECNPCTANDSTIYLGTDGRKWRKVTDSSASVSLIKRSDSVFVVKANGQETFAYRDSVGVSQTYVDSVIEKSTIRDITWSVLDSLRNPPGTPKQGDKYLVAPNATGTYTGHVNQIASYDTTAGWTFQSASLGDLLYNTANFNTYKWTGTAWQLRPPLPVNNWWRNTVLGNWVGNGSHYPPGYYAQSSAGARPFMFFTNSSIGLGHQVFEWTGNMGNDNIAIGHVNQYHNAGNRNISLGTYSLWYNVSGHDQVAIGYQAAQAGNQSYSIGLGTNVKNVSRQFSISDSTTKLYFRLEPAAVGTTPAYLIGRSTSGQWYSYSYSGSGIGGSYIPTSEKGVSNGVATLDGGGKVPVSQLPALTVNQPSYVQHLSDMLALSAAIGDIVVVGDSSKSYALVTLPASVFANWLELQSPIPTNTDLLSEGSTNLYYTQNRARNAISAGDGIIYNSSTGAISKKKPDWLAASGSEEEIVNKPTIPAQFSPLAGNNIDLSGVYPNITFDTKNIYTIIQTDSIATQLRSEISIAAGGGVTLSQLDSVHTLSKNELADTANVLRGLVKTPTLDEVVSVGNTTTEQIKAGSFIAESPDQQRIEILSVPYGSRIHMPAWQNTPPITIQNGGFTSLSGTLYLGDAPIDKLSREPNGYGTRVQFPILVESNTNLGLFLPIRVNGFRADSSGNISLKIINDSITSTTATYSSSKINSLIASAGGGSNNPDSLSGYKGADYLRKTEAATSYYPLTGNPSNFLTSVPAQTWESITGKPTLFDGDYNSLINKPTLFDGTWTSLTGKPSTFTPSAHTHSAADITSGTLAIGRIPTGTTSTTVSLGNHTHTFASLTSKPTTLSGYGITDAQSTIIGAATTITSSNLTTNRALISNDSGKVAVSSVTSTELGYVAGVTSSIQTQLNSKISGNQTITLSGDVSGSGTTAITTTIGAGKVTNAMLANSTISGISLGNNLNMLSAGTGLKFTTGTAYNGGVAREISADFGITAGKVVDGKQFIDSIAAIRALATSVYDTVYADSPLHVRDSSGKQTLFIDTASATKDGVLLASKYTEFNNKVSSQWTTNGSDINYSTGNVGIGVASPAYKLDVDGDVNVSATNGFRINGYKALYAMPTLNSYFVGNNAGNTTLTTGYSIGIGVNALNKLTSGGFNIAIGHTALANATTGGNNTAIGNKGMYSTVGGAGNVSVGAEAMYTNTGGSYNTGVGYVSLQYNINGTNNTAVGFGSLRNAVNGYYNTAIGSNAGKVLVHGNNNIFIGNEAGNNASQEDTVTNTIVIGYNQYSTASNQLNIGGIINGNLTTGNIDLTGRIKKRIGSEASSATPTINAKNYDIYKITALAVNITNMSTNFTLPDFEGDEIEIWITGTASRTISWGSSFVASTVSLPTTTSGTNTLHCVFIREGATMTIKYVY